jgi:hypothetical protein
MVPAGDVGARRPARRLEPWLFGRRATALDVGLKWEYAVVARRGHVAALAGVLDRQRAQGDDKENCRQRTWLLTTSATWRNLETGAPDVAVADRNELGSQFLNLSIVLENMGCRK